MFWDHSLVDLFYKTGLTSWPLLFCSIVGFAIIVERSFFFLRLRLSYEGFLKGLFDLLENKKTKEAEEYCLNHPNPVVRIAGVYIQNRNSYFRDGILSREGSYALELLERRMRGLAAITHIAPLLGLLGTVAGLVSAFHEIQLLGGQVQAENLAGGIWEALLSTVFGLIVAIPCMAAYHAFESQTDRITRRMQFIVSELDQFFGNTKTNKFLKSQAERSSTGEMNVTE